MREFFTGVVAIAEWGDLVSDEHFSAKTMFSGLRNRSARE